MLVVGRIYKISVRSSAVKNYWRIKQKEQIILVGRTFHDGVFSSDAADRQPREVGNEINIV